MIVQVLGAFLGVISVTILYGIEKKYMPVCGFIGAVGWLIYLLWGTISTSASIRTYVAALVVSLMAHSCARIFKAPVTIYLIPGILPLVPGIGMYRTVYNLIRGETVTAGYYFSETMKIAGVIALAIFCMDTVFRLIFKPRKKI